nr:MAG TPA: hypothetical protein [Caudoviricetes sp.]
MYKLIILFITWNLIISNFYQTSLKVNLVSILRM